MAGSDQNRYYYNQMNKAQQAAYHAMLTGFTAIAPVFPVVRLDMRELAEIFFRLRLDNPWLFYIESYHCRYAQDADVYQMIPEYMFEKKKIKEHQKALQNRVARLVREASGLKTVEEKELFIHDFICKNVTYDKLKKSYSHEIIGPLQQGVSVCEGIAKTVKLLCDELGIPCIIALCDADPANGVKYRHVWNVLKINKKWYHMDATFDNSLGTPDQIRYDYFNIDDKQIYKDHRRVIYPVPECTDNKQFYYLVNRMSLTKMEDVGKRLQQAIRKKKPVFIFHWRGGYLGRKVFFEIAETAKQAAEEKGKYISMSFNYGQAVIQLRILDELPEEIQEEIAEETPEVDFSKDEESK